jgi:hypothetical protein
LWPPADDEQLCLVERMGEDLVDHLPNWCPFLDQCRGAGLQLWHPRGHLCIRERANR